MSRLNELRGRIDDADSALEDAKNDMHSYLTPIVKAFSGLDKMPGYFHEMHVYDGTAYITFRHEASGGPYDTDFNIPLVVFEKAEADAVAAAQAAREAREQKKKDEQRARDEAAFEALRQKLGK